MSSIRQGACPRCPSSDAYTEYDDGGTHCFSCGWHTPGNAYKKLLGKAIMHPNKVVLEKCPLLPEDAIGLIGLAHTCRTHKTLEWLSHYGITLSEIDTHQFCWSEGNQYLIFPVYDPRGNLIMWQARYFGDNPRHPKYLTRGFKEDVLHVLGQPGKSPFLNGAREDVEPRTDSIVLVEDLISAIKVSRVTPAMPLWGSSLSPQNAHRLSLVYGSAYLWLDYDKREEAVKQAIKHSLSLSIHPIITKLDPKCYGAEDIREKIKPATCG